jgi:hypothetical protein
VTKIGPQADLHSEAPLIRHGDADMSDLVGALVGAAGKFVRGTPFEDDVCLVGGELSVSSAEGRGGLDPGLSLEDAFA